MNRNRSALSLLSRVSLLAPAKLNLFLKVFGKRPDGYHDIRSIMAPVSLYDEVIVEKTLKGIVVECDAAGIPTDETNSCFRAASCFKEWSGFSGGVRIILRKNIPAEAGLGGGSSDAAAVLKCLSVLTGFQPSPEEYIDMASRIGADVPFFTLGTAALAEGRGETLTPIPLTIPFYAVIVKPCFGISTREGYAKLDRGAQPTPPKGNVPYFKDFADIASCVHNDFEEVLAREFPEIVKIKNELLSANAAVAGLSGSGSAMFGLFPSEEKAREGLARMQSRTEGANARECFIAGSII